MADRDDNDWGNYKLGFKRPPPWNQFQKGQSGNPKGRPKGTGKKAMKSKAVARRLTGSEAILDRLAEEEVELSLSGKKVRMTKKEALRHAQISLAIKGNPLAMRDINRDIAQVEARKAEIEHAAAEAAQQAAHEQAKQEEALFSCLVELKDKQSRAWAKAAAEGKDEPAAPWPHPDDILIDHAARKARVRGPLCGESVADWEYSRRRRDHYLARMVLAGYSHEPSASVLTKVWLACLAEEEQHLPRRWQILHDLGPATNCLLAMRLPRLEAIVAEGAAEFERSRPGPPQSKASYQRQNRVWGPLVKALGYRSLRHFERTVEEAGLPA